MEFLSELWMFMMMRKKYWLIPLIILFVIFGVLVVFVNGSALSPFIYTIF